MLDIALLGTGGMIPLPDRYLTAMLARHKGRMLLIDCGEGTQVSMRLLGWGFVDLDYILITHFHADHTAGLPGLLLSLSNYGRTDKLTIVGPKGIEKVVDGLRIIAPQLLYPIEFLELGFRDEPTISFLLGEFNIAALPLQHAVDCIGYSLYIPRSGKFDVVRAKAQNIPMEYWSRLQGGEAVGGFTPDMVLGPERKGIKVSYITDTRPIDTIPDFISGSDLFICEGMYGEEGMKPKAQRAYHMLISEAAGLAKAGEVKELWLTHYSQAFRDPENYIDAAAQHFENVKAGQDRMCKTLVFDPN